MYDALTGLYDRTTFISALEKKVSTALMNESSMALLVVDLRRLARINRSFGRRGGDFILSKLADKIVDISREGDVVGRIGDDQFALLLPSIANIGHAKLAALNIQRMLDTPFEYDGWVIRPSASIGVATMPTQASEADLLLQLSMDAVEEAKRLEQPIVFFSSEETARTNSVDWDIENALSDSIVNSELVVYFQPKLSLTTGCPVGAEALVRWQSQEKGLLMPGDFLPVAETIGFLKPLSIWMLNGALRCSLDWTDKWGNLGVSVNIPPSMMGQPDFVDLILNAQNLWKNNSSFLCLEILEQALIDDVQLVFKRLNMLRDKGVSISIDDFGTGYSSLSYFRDIPADELKIDRSFVKNLTSDSVSRNIVGLIIEMAQLFNLKVVAEGVEDKETMSFLKSQGCDYVQGFYLAKPMPAEEFQHWLEEYEPVH